MSLLEKYIFIKVLQRKKNELYFYSLVWFEFTRIYIYICLIYMEIIYLGTYQEDEQKKYI